MANDLRADLDQLLLDLGLPMRRDFAAAAKRRQYAVMAEILAPGLQFFVAKSALIGQFH
jgi:hypothetical protein